MKPGKPDKILDVAKVMSETFIVNIQLVVLQHTLLQCIRCYKRLWFSKCLSASLTFIIVLTFLLAITIFYSLVQFLRVAQVWITFILSTQKWFRYKFTFTVSHNSLMVNELSWKLKCDNIAVYLCTRKLK